MKPDRRVNRITKGKASRLVAAIEAIRTCDDVSPELIRAFDDVRAAISPFYDYEACVQHVIRTAESMGITLRPGQS